MQERHDEYMKRRMQQSTLGDIFDATLEEVKRSQDPIDPPHYNNHEIEPITYIMANGFDFCEGNIIKYVSRWKEKGGVSDLRKAHQYLEFLIKQEEEGSPL